MEEEEQRFQVGRILTEVIILIFFTNTEDEKDLELSLVAGEVIVSCQGESPFLLPPLHRHHHHHHHHHSHHHHYHHHHHHHHHYHHQEGVPLYFADTFR